MDLSEYVGLPFEERGRTRAGADCWGVLALIYRERLGISLPSYDDRYASIDDRQHLASIIAGEIGPWRPVEAGCERVGDGVLMSPAHVGIVAGPGLVLHTERATGSIIDRTRSPRIAARLRGYFRHESLS